MIDELSAFAWALQPGRWYTSFAAGFIDAFMHDVYCAFVCRAIPLMPRRCFRYCRWAAADRAAAAAALRFQLRCAVTRALRQPLSAPAPRFAASRLRLSSPMRRRRHADIFDRLITFSIISLPLFSRERFLRYFAADIDRFRFLRLIAFSDLITSFFRRWLFQLSIAFAPLIIDSFAYTD